MSKVDDLEKERDALLYQMEHSYRARQEEVESKKEELKNQVEAKQALGEDASKEVEQYKEYCSLQDKYFDDYRYERESVYQRFENEISKEIENDYEMGY